MANSRSPEIFWSLGVKERKKKKKKLSSFESLCVLVFPFTAYALKKTSQQMPKVLFFLFCFFWLSPLLRPLRPREVHVATTWLIILIRLALVSKGYRSSAGIQYRNRKNQETQQTRPSLGEELAKKGEKEKAERRQGGTKVEKTG